MYQGTTPAIVYTIGGADLSAMTAYVSFLSNNNVLTKTGNNVSMTYDSESNTTTVVCCLTQEETLAMMKGSVKTQIRFVDSANNAYATDKASIAVSDVIYKEVITYNGGD